VKEIWKDILGYKGLYSISNCGKVKSFIKHNGTNERILKPYKNNKGYLVVHLSKNDKRKLFKIHKLVLEAFVGPCPPGMESCHNNGNKENNFIGNLRYDTHKNNNRDKNKHGTMPDQRGSKNGNSLAKDCQVKEIKILLTEGKLNIREISEKCKISIHIVKDIKRNRTWKHIN